MRILVLSDTHFGTAPAAVSEALLRLTAQLEPQVVLISGDLTQRATDEEFEAAAAFLKRLPPVPRLVIPGNHDIPLWRVDERLRRPYRAFERLLGRAWEGGGVAQLDGPGLRVVAPDTTRWWRHRHGTLSHRQIERVAQALHGAAPGDWRIVMTHHPLVVMQARDHEDRPWRHRKALSLWQAAGADTFIAGHLHEPAVMAVGSRAAMVQTGTSLSWRLPPGQHNSVVLLEQDGPPADRTRWCTTFTHDPLRDRFDGGLPVRLPPVVAPSSSVRPQPRLVGSGFPGRASHRFLA